MFRVFALAYPIMTTSVLDLHSLCTTANWIITQRQAEDGHFLEEGAVIMAWMQVPTPTPPRTPPPPAWPVQIKPRLCALIGESQAPDLFTGKKRTGKSQGLAPSTTCPCSGPPCTLLLCHRSWAHLGPQLSLTPTSSRLQSWLSFLWAESSEPPPSHPYQRVLLISLQE